MYLYKVIGALIQNLIFQNGVGGHFWFWPLEKIAGIFGRDMEAKFLIKGPKKSNQASNLTSQRMVTESRFMTQLLLIQYESTELGIIRERASPVLIDHSYHSSSYYRDYSHPLANQKHQGGSKREMPSATGYLPEHVWTEAPWSLKPFNICGSCDLHVIHVSRRWRKVTHDLTREHNYPSSSSVLVK